MAIRIRGIRGFTLALAALAALGVGSMSAQAAVIVVDPGVVGGLSNSPIVAGQLVPASDPFLDVRFADMKHVEAVRWGFGISELAPGATDGAITGGLAQSSLRAYFITTGGAAAPVATCLEIESMSVLISLTF